MSCGGPEQKKVPCAPAASPASRQRLCLPSGKVHLIAPCKTRSRSRIDRRRRSMTTLPALAALTPTRPPIGWLPRCALGPSYASCRRHGGPRRLPALHGCTACLDSGSERSGCTFRCVLVRSCVSTVLRERSRRLEDARFPRHVRGAVGQSLGWLHPTLQK